MSDITTEEAIKDLKSLIEEYKDCSVEGLDMQVDVGFNEERCKNLEKVLNELETLQNGFNTAGEHQTELIRENSHFRYELFNNQKELKEKDKIIDELKKHIHYKICPNCNKEFKAKRSDAIFCPQCRSKMNNKYYFKNLTEEQKDIRRQKVRESMRRYRAKKRKVKDE